MIVAYVVHELGPDDLIGPQELPALPTSGAIISGIDRNSNKYRLKVTSVEFFVASTDPERKEMQLALGGETRIRITGTSFYD
ncbi:hypothetical protein [Erythrobacter sanguineus]|uniref:Uncharacterized protein n=1 Tax=Erythrobacter sanguineus TaxID=198312 RepID=A0A1M7RUT4_9SPHN|nr:hypothetical protein [Erythrobacter sanguineus]SHN49970.1 hypothetical protein SAMN02745193_00446 [Erythrobacter sanguineus]